MESIHIVLIVILLLIAVYYFNNSYNKSKFGIITADPYKIQGSAPPSQYDYITSTTQVYPSDVNAKSIDYNNLM